MATGLVPTQGVLSFFDSILNIAATVVNPDYLRGRELGIGHNESDPWEEFPIVPRDLGHNSTLSVPGLCLVPEINESDLNPALGRAAHGTGQIRVNESIQHRIGGKPDEVRDPFTCAVLVHIRIGKCRIPTEPEEDESGPISLHNRI